MKLQFLGSGDAFGSGGRFNTCFHVAHDGGAFLIDCGASSLVAIRRFGIDPNAIHTIILSHLHGDHFGGLPFFILDGQFYSRRTAPLAIVGPPGTRARVTDAMEIFFPGSVEAKRKFALEFHEIDEGAAHAINGATITPFRVAHECGAPPFALRIECAGRTIAYSGDTEWTENLVAAARGADLFIAEALTFERKIRFHLDFATLKANLARIGAKRVILTHMGPDMLDHANCCTDEELASDGATIEI